MQPKNLADPRTFERGMPHDYFAWLQEHEPVHWQEPHDGALQPERVPQRGFWVVTRYSDVQMISRDQRTFSSERGTTIIRDMGGESTSRLSLWMINQDSPRHTRLRKLSPGATG